MRTEELISSSLNPRSGMDNPFLDEREKSVNFPHYETGTA